MDYSDNQASIAGNMRFNYIWQHLSELIALALLGIAVVLTITLSSSLETSRFQNTVYQAEAFLYGQLHYLTIPGDISDTVLRQGRYYSAAGPLPALTLVPAVAIFGLGPWQSILHPIWLLLVIYLAYRLARNWKFSHGDSLWLAAAVSFGSIFFSVAYIPYAGQYASALAFVLALAMLYEFHNRRRYHVLGLIFAAIIATRATVGLIGMAVVAQLLLDSTTAWRLRMRRLVWILGPMLLVGMCLLWYNSARFGNLFDSGYLDAAAAQQVDMTARQQYGLFSLRNIPTNVYFSFLASPRVVIDTATLRLAPPYLTFDSMLGFFWLSPIFLYLLGFRPRRTPEVVYGIAAVATVVVILSYYSIEYRALGPRYLVDALPLLYVLLLERLRGQKLSPVVRVIVAGSTVFNMGAAVAKLVSSQ